MNDATLLPGEGEIEYDDAEDVYRFRHDLTGELTSTAVVSAVATIAGTDPTELEPLRNSVDPEALDDLFAPTHGGRDRLAGRIEFTLDDYRVVVDATGEVEIRPLE